MYGGYVVVIAHDEQEALGMANAEYGESNPDCRDNVALGRVIVLDEVGTGVWQVWNGE